MRTLLVVLALLIAAVAAAQRMTTKDLSVSTRPTTLPQVFAGMKAVSVSEFTFTDGTLPLRVFRYTYAANFEKEILRLEQLLKKDEWVLRPRQPGSSATFYRSGYYGRQTIALNIGKWIRAEGRPLNTRMYFPKGERWVRVSYNEPGAVARPVR